MAPTRLYVLNAGSEMKILTVIFDPDEITRILSHLVKIGRSPPNFDPASLVAEATSPQLIVIFSNPIMP